MLVFLILLNLSLCEIPLPIAVWQHQLLDAQNDKKGTLTLLPEPRMINSVPLVQISQCQSLKFTKIGQLVTDLKQNFH